MHNTSKKPKVLCFPKDPNPYQALLYGPMREAAVSYFRFFPLFGGLPFWVCLPLARASSHNVVHVHWQRFDFPFRQPIAKKASYALFRLTVRSMKALGFKIVWTVHNVVPHEPHTSDDAGAARLLSKAAAAKIVHSRHTISQMEELGLDTSNVKVIPHGNYNGAYPLTLTPEQARERLHVEPHEKVILFFGNVRPYKGVDELIDAFEKLDTKVAARLVIAGKCTDGALRARIERAARANSRIDFYDQFVPDEEVQCYFQAADVVCLPFNSITTSGSVLLAVTFGKPIVTPRLGAVQDVPNSVGVLYDPTEEDALVESLRLALSSEARLATMSEASIAYSKTLSWEKIAAETYKVYEEVLR